SNCTFAANSGQYGGGLYSGGTLTVSNSTFAANSAVSGGGGIFNNNGTPHLDGNIVAGNLNSTSMAADDNGGFGLDPSSSNNLIGVDTTTRFQNGQNGNQVGVSVAKVGLAPLGDYGGPTQTFALLPGSFAL